MKAGVFPIRKMPPENRRFEKRLFFCEKPKPAAGSMNRGLRLGRRGITIKNMAAEAKSGRPKNLPIGRK